VVWFSCGAASAVAAKLTLEKHPAAVVVYCDTSRSEHPDNRRFRKDVEKWVSIKVKVIASEKFKTVDEVFAKTRYMAGIKGARCTTEMKKIPRFEFQRADDVHIFGFTVDEQKRIIQFKRNNPELLLEWPLSDGFITKDRCHSILREAGIKPPKMYELGYKNNNCLGCVKATSPGYWNMTRRDFPGVFSLRCKQSRELGVRLTRVKGKRIFLDELPTDAWGGLKQNVSCGPECGVEGLE